MYIGIVCDPNNAHCSHASQSMYLVSTSNKAAIVLSHCILYSSPTLRLSRLEASNFDQSSYSMIEFTVTNLLSHVSNTPSWLTTHPRNGDRTWWHPLAETFFVGAKPFARRICLLSLSGTILCIVFITLFLKGRFCCLDFIPQQLPVLFHASG